MSFLCPTRINPISYRIIEAGGDNNAKGTVYLCILPEAI